MLGVLFFGLVLILMLAVPGLAIGYVEHAGVQSAADAAALACASQATVTNYVDARGQVYRRTAVVDPNAGPQAGATAWGDNLSYWPLQTVSFAATPSGADCTVQVEVESTVPILQLLGQGRQTFQFGSTAEAKAYITPP